MSLITFTAIDKTWQLTPAPKSALKYIPEWYRSFPKSITPESNQKIVNFFGKVFSSGTVKICNPFLDSLQFGYIIELPCDVEFTKNEQGEIFFKWGVANLVPVETHNSNQFPVNGLNDNCFPLVYKFNFGWEIKTPKGYSCLFTHPLNQHHLPFITFSGVVETDNYPLNVNFPFQLYKFENDSLIIPAGTPIAQVIPFKRNNWKSVVMEKVKDNLQKDLYELYKSVYNSYKNKWWRRKTYK